MALQQLFCCFCLQTVSNLVVAVVWYLCREADWLLDRGRNAVGSVWLSDTAAIFMCFSGTHRSSHSAAQCKKISVLCRGMVNPCDLRCCGFVPLNVLYLNTRGEKSFFVYVVKGALRIPYWALQITFLFQRSLCMTSSLWLSCDISNWDLLHCPPAAPGHAVLSTNSVLHLPSLKTVEFIWLLPKCLSCRLYYQILNFLQHNWFCSAADVFIQIAASVS